SRELLSGEREGSGPRSVPRPPSSHPTVERRRIRTPRPPGLRPHRGPKGAGRPRGEDPGRDGAALNALKAAPSLRGLVPRKGLSDPWEKGSRSLCENGPR